ncbi:MAG: HPr family phosphocarrier protein [Eubacteriales bacterium]|nr:HPr family phosphocarrier protein [Eubacteriales bacterium]
MVTKSMVVNIPAGLDPSTVAMFIQIASQYESKIYVEVEEKKVNAKSIMGMMSLGLPEGSDLTMIADGSDEVDAIDHIQRYLNNEQ